MKNFWKITLVIITTSILYTGLAFADNSTTDSGSLSSTGTQIIDNSTWAISNSGAASSSDTNINSWATLAQTGTNSTTGVTLNNSGSITTYSGSISYTGGKNNDQFSDLRAKVNTTMNNLFIGLDRKYKYNANLYINFLGKVNDKIIHLLNTDVLSQRNRVILNTVKYRVELKINNIKKENSDVNIWNLFK